MGYTHYWANTGFTDEQFQVLRGAALLITSEAKKQGIALAGPDGEGEVDLGDPIALNGAGDAESHESFVLDSKASDFEFCKTAQKPYDAVVVALLGVAAAINPKGFGWSSDGDAEDHADGMALARACGFEPKPANRDSFRS